MKFESKCLHSGYTPGNGEPQATPIYQSTTFRYQSTEHVAKLFDLTENGFFYSRLANPTVDMVEKKIADLEGGVGAMCTSSGQSASFMSLVNILGAGDHFVASAAIYGGTFNLFNVTMRKLGIDVTFVDNYASEEEIQKAIKPNTKAIFGETITNPSIEIFDIEKFANIAHKNNIPLIVDNTFATPYLCRPIEFGADIVIHSTTKYMDGHAIQMGGVIVDSGNFDWAASGKFPEFTVPDDSYHGVVYTETFGNMAYIVKARVQLMRDFGCNQTPMGAFYVSQGLETLPIRMERHSENAEKVAAFLEARDDVEFVTYPSLDSYKHKELAQKYLPKGYSGVIAFSLKGGRKAGETFIDSLQLASLVVHVADIRTCVLHPASSTHRQLTEEQLLEGGVTPGLIRLSVGLENIDDILADLEQALNKAKNI
ncbi:MAG: O-acetylhomoserine aminocarboxypropyltransferase/cysteine synthase [Clostridia bacterium]|nr:O-acetylhomoserine aminocarboxypropyltransferase/cysteine synthase [Clostridia bacterium]